MYPGVRERYKHATEETRSTTKYPKKKKKKKRERTGWPTTKKKAVYTLRIFPFRSPETGLSQTSTPVRQGRTEVECLLRESRRNAKFFFQNSFQSRNDLSGVWPFLGVFDPHCLYNLAFDESRRVNRTEQNQTCEGASELPYHDERIP